MLQTFAALGDPNRFRIVELLRTGALPVNDIGGRLQLNQPQVSKHLRVLRDAGLVEVEPRSRQRLYSLRPDGLRAMSGWLERYRQLWDARFEELDGLLEELKSKESNHAHRKGK